MQFPEWFVSMCLVLWALSLVVMVVFGFRMGVWDMKLEAVANGAAFWAVKDKKNGEVAFYWTNQWSEKQIKEMTEK